MKKKAVLLAFVLVFLSTALSLCVVGLLRLQIAYASPYTDINVATAYNMITSGLYPNLVVLDVRTKSEYDSGHIYGAVWIPVSELATRIGELAGHENHEIIVYCAAGSRSVTASGILDSHSFTKVYNMLGGISAWQSAGYPVWIATVHNVNTTFNYDTIQAAIDASQTLDGHTILVDAGTYYEHVTINKSISLIGENKYNTIIDGNGTGKVIRLPDPSHINITGFTIQNGGSGIYIELSYGHNISHNIITNNHDGIFADYPLDNTISNNDIFSNKGYGIYLGSWSSGNTISGNNVSNNGYGIYLYTSFPNTFRNNNINNNTYNFGVNPWIEIWPYRYDIDTSNTVNGKPIYWWLNQQNKEIPSDAGYVGVVNSKNITVKDLDLSKNGQGVFFANTNNSIITNVSLSNNNYGIFLLYSHNNVIFHNNFINNTNQAYVYVYDSYNNIWDDGYPSGGNYWSDYDGKDLYKGVNRDQHGSDGIGDTPYDIEWQNRDNYPLMNPYGSPPPQTYNLTITTTVGGTTDPAPGTYTYTEGTAVSVTAIPYINYVFDHWELDVSWKYFNPISVTMDTDHALHGVFVVGIPDVAITNVTPSKTFVGQGYFMSINVTVENQGDGLVIFNVTTYYYDTPIETKTVTNVLPGEETTVTFTWNTAGVPYGNYTISAYATPVPGETDTADNTYPDGWIVVTIPGDVDGDHDVDVGDQRKVQLAMFTAYPDPVYVQYNTHPIFTDVDGDGDVDVGDQRIQQLHMFESW